MKKLLLSVLATVIVITGVLGAQTNVKVTKSDDNKTTLVFNIGSYQLQKVETSKGIAFVPTIDEAVSILNAGYPAMLRISESIVIPDKGQSEITIIDAKYKTIEDIEIAPSKGNLYRNVMPSDVPYTYGEVYKQDAFYPELVAELGHNYILRDFRGQTVWINPIQYNPVTKEMRVYTEVTVQISNNNKKGNNELTRTQPLEKISTIYNQIYKNQFANYEQIQAKYTPLSEEGNMLVIAPTTYLETMVPFVAWKNQSGVPTEIVDLSDVGTTASQIETYIENYYTENGLTFVLLIGDDEQLTATSTSSGDSDPAYGYISGNDSYAEIIIGRFSGSESDVAMMVQKTISYEQTPVTTDAMYDRFALIASSEGSGGQGDDGESDVQHMRNIKPDLTGFTYTETDSYEFFDGTEGELDAPGNPTASMVVSAINNGISVMGYVGHGSDYALVTTGFGTSSFGSLTNTEFWPFMFDVACVNGNFVGQTCFAEGFIRATYNDQPAGALALCASTINQSWAPPMSGEDEMFDLLVNSYEENIKHTFGGIHVGGCMQMNDDYGSQGDEMTDTWIIFGDPSVMVRTATPDEVAVNSDPVIFLGNPDYLVTCDTEGARATLSIDGEIIAIGTVEGGEANLTFEGLTEPTTAILTVIGFNKGPSITEIQVVPASGPYMKVDAINISDVDGNNNQMADYGETINLSIDVKNVGSDEATDLIVSVVTVDEYITVSGDPYEFGAVGAESIVSLSDIFEVTISENTPDQHKAAIVFTITDGNRETWTTNGKITINAPAFEISEMTLANDNDDNGRLDPGETADINFTVNNVGHADATNVLGTLSGDSPYFTIMNLTVSDNIMSEASTSYTFNVEASAGTPQGTPVNLNFDVTLRDYTDATIEAIVIGQPAEIGIGDGTEDSGNYPFYSYYKSNRTQMLYLGSEIGAGEITIQEIAFDFSRIDNGITTMTDFKINFIETSVTELGTAYADMTDATTVLQAAAYTMPQALGYQSFDIDDYVFNASNNLIVEIIWGVNSSYGDYQAFYVLNSTTTDFTSVAYGYSDTEIPTYDGNNSARPNIMLYTESEAPGNMYTANFTVTDGTNPIEGATVIIGSMEQTVDANGQTSFDLYEGTYYYSVSADGYPPVVNETMVVDDNMDMTISMTGIASYANNDLKLYPNPTNGNVTVELPYTVSGAIITVFDLTGKTIATQKLESAITTIDLSNVSEGVYFININAGENNTTQKLIINK